MSAQRRPPDVDDEFLTVTEVAAILTLDRQTIRNRIDQGSLAALRVGRRVRVLRRNLDLVIAEAEAASRVHEPIALEMRDEKEGWRRRPAVLGRRVAPSVLRSIMVTMTARGSATHG
jgi:excisionase family DNA binding protein